MAQRGSVSSARRRRLPVASVLASVLVILGVAVGLVLLRGPVAILVPAWYLVLSLVTFAVYALDKRAAERGAWRTSESTLWLLGLAVGWPGGLLGQSVLRHKTRKASFLAVFWVTVVANVAVIVWLIPVISGA